tara:strand:+ start:78 stop:551 length:474 start_codon:yes stop_codon:yes gene_type:complete
MNQVNEERFFEIQRFTNPLFWIVLLGSGIFSLGIIYATGELGYGLLMIFTLLYGLIVGFIYVHKLTTCIDKTGLSFRFFPYHWSARKYEFKNILSYEVIIYKPLRDYGGWGIRFGKGERVYNVKGNKGIRIRFIDGKKIMLGTQKSDDFIRAMKFYE